MMFRLAMAGILLLVACGQVTAQGVVVPQGGFGDKVEVVGDRPVQAAESPSSWQDLYAIPQDDAGKWHLVVFHDDSEKSQQLLQDIQTDPDLRNVVAWFNTNYYSIESASQAMRFSEFKVQRDQLPLVCVFPPRGSAEYPYCYAFRHTGYRGPARWFAAQIVATLRAFVKVFRPNRGPCPGPNCPVTPGPTPNYPAPSPVYPTPTPVTPPTPLPNIPDLVVPVTPVPDAPVAPTPVDGEFPDYPMITVIVDPHGIGENLKAKALEIVVEKVREAYPEIGGAKARVLDLNDPEAKKFPVTPDDTPAVFLTAKGKITGYLNKGTLAVLKDVLTLPDVPVPDARPVVNVAPVVTPVVQTDPALARALQDQANAQKQAADEQGKLHTALAALKAGGGSEAIAAALKILGISVPGAAALLGLFIALAAWIYKKRGGHEGFRQRHNARLDWIHDHLPPRLAARTGAIRRKLRERFHPDELADMDDQDRAAAVADAVDELDAEDEPEAPAVKGKRNG